MGSTRSESAVGAALYGLEASGRSLAVQRESYVAADSRISDADVAADAASLAAATIIQRTGASLLAQANQEPALALSLLD